MHERAENLIRHRQGTKRRSEPAESGDLLSGTRVHPTSRVGEPRRCAVQRPTTLASKGMCVARTAFLKPRPSMSFREFEHVAARRRSRRWRRHPRATARTSPCHDRCQHGIASSDWASARPISSSACSSLIIAQDRACARRPSVKTRTYPCNWSAMRLNCSANSRFHPGSARRSGNRNCSSSPPSRQRREPLFSQAGRSC